MKVLVKGTRVEAGRMPGLPGSGRSQRGSSLLEIPVSIWLVIVVMFLPLLSLTSITLRSTLMSVALQDAIHAAAKAKNFELDSPQGKSAKSTAANTLAQRAADFSGLSIGSIDVDILQTRITNQQIQRFEEKLPQPADSTVFVYEIEGEAKGIIEPIFQMDPAIVGSIPGLSVPFQVSYRAREIFENPQGLNR